MGKKPSKGSVYSMCGFTGFVGKVDHSERVVERMMNCIIHRGPDDGGFYADDEVALGLRRLSIIDLEHGRQPMYNEDGSLVLVFNGEIYNYQDLRDDLISKGHQLLTHCDSEVLIHCYEEYKHEMLPKLRGMFAFVIWDKRSKTLFGARDYFGIKPFYYAPIKTETGAHILLVGSELKSFLVHPHFDKQLNRDALHPYLTFQVSVLNETFFKGVFKLPAGNYFTYHDGRLEIEKYWDISFEPDGDGSGLDYYVDLIEKAVKESVDAHRISNVEVGSYLSSGVDSSYITACLVPDKTFSVGFKNDGFDETGYARELSSLLKIDNFAEILNPDECFASFPRIQYHMDEPSSNLSAIPLYFLSRLAGRHVKVVLSGEGADEIFAGYDWYGPDIPPYYAKVPPVIRKTLSRAAMRMPHFKGRNLLIKGGGRVEDYFLGQTEVFRYGRTKRILKESFFTRTRPIDITAPYFERNPVDGYSDIEKKQCLDYYIRLQADMLQKADKMSMAHSVELRVPFLDVEVMKVAARVPTRFKYCMGQSKYALRKAAERQVPPEWAKRKKIAFYVPVGLWLREKKYYDIVRKTFESRYAGEFFNQKAIMKLLNEHYGRKRSNTRKIWALFSFLTWYKAYFIDNVYLQTSCESPRPLAGS